MNACHIKIRQTLGVDKSFAGIFEIDAKLIFAKASRDIRMTFGVDIGIDADRNARMYSDTPCNFIYDFQLFDAFNIERVDVRPESELDFVIGFPDTGKGDFLR